MNKLVLALLVLAGYTSAQDTGDCGLNEHWNSCGSSCSSDACSSPSVSFSKSRPTVYCTDVCVPRCECDSGFRRYEGTCVQSYRCPTTTCQATVQKWYTCFSAVSCGDDRCDALKDPNAGVCNNIQCPYGCFCNYEAGYRKNERGECVPQEKCPAKCKDPNSYYSISAPNEVCPNASADVVTEPNCVCSPDFCRDGTGKCVRKV